MPGLDTPGDHLCPKYNCEVCYFCKNQHTTDIAHRKGKQKVKFVNTRTGLVSWTETCTDGAVDLNKGGSYYRMCYRNNKDAVGTNGKKLTPAQRKKKPQCGSDRMGCIQCNEIMCEDCWKNGYNKHEGVSKK